MKVFDTIHDLRNELKKDKETLALVPTMGALHEGHLSLVDLARSKAERVGVSIFVNPMQFNNASDLEKYPRDIERDLELLRGRGVEYVFTPHIDHVYGSYQGTKVTPSKLGSVMEGPMRPGHFEGVCTVVNILFNIFKADVAVFGEKDFQQLRIIEDMVSDLSLDISIIRAEISREEGGLARSSRNERLSTEDREKARIIFKALDGAVNLVKGGEVSTEVLLEKGKQILSEISELELEYLSVHDEGSLEEVSLLSVERKCRMFFAGYLGGVRLIDNIALY